MPLISRTRPVPKPVIVLPKRKLRFTTNNAGSRAAKATLAKEQINVLLKSISDAHALIDEGVALQDAVCTKIEEIMRENRMTDHSDGVYLASIRETFTRQSRTVDPKKFKANVGAADFWEAISVSIAKAEKIMTEKELNAISDVVPSKSNGFKFTVDKVEKKVRR